MEIALLAEGDHLFDVRTDSFGLGHGGLHAIFYDDGRDQVAQQSATMAGVASEFVSCIAMAHDVNSLSKKLLSSQSFSFSPRDCAHSELVN